MLACGQNLDTPAVVARVIQTAHSDSMTVQRSMVCVSTAVQSLWNTIMQSIVWIDEKMIQNKKYCREMGFDEITEHNATDEQS